MVLVSTEFIVLFIVCSKTWVPKGTYLEGLPETCNEALHLTVELITDGEFSIQYFHTYIGVVAMARVRESYNTFTCTFM